MPYKHSEDRRHKFEKPRYKVTNWLEYNAALRRRGDFTLWFTEEAIAGWRPAKTEARGRPAEYSDVAIETTLFIRQVFHLPLRQTEGLMNSLARALRAEISIPDFSCISKRSIGLPRHALSKAPEPGSLVIVDSTGLKVYGKGEWHQEKHDVAARRTWRKLHLAIDEHHQVLACELTTPEVGDTTAVPDRHAGQRHRDMPQALCVLLDVHRGSDRRRVQRNSAAVSAASTRRYVIGYIHGVDQNEQT